MHENDVELPIRFTAGEIQWMRYYWEAMKSIRDTEKRFARLMEPKRDLTPETVLQHIVEQVMQKLGEEPRPI